MPFHPKIGYVFSITLTTDHPRAKPWYHQGILCTHSLHFLVALFFFRYFSSTHNPSSSNRNNYNAPLSRCASVPCNLFGRFLAYPLSSIRRNPWGQSRAVGNDTVWYFWLIVSASFARSSILLFIEGGWLFNYHHPLIK
jgi:hypothetical protein